MPTPNMTRRVAYACLGQELKWISGELDDIGQTMTADPLTPADTDRLQEIALQLLALSSRINGWLTPAPE